MITTKDFKELNTGPLKYHDFQKWLKRVTKYWRRKDKADGLITDAVTRADYERVICDSIKLNKGLDSYTGKTMNWKLVATPKPGTRDNYYPTIDHVNGRDKPVTPSSNVPELVVCADRTNKVKSDLSLNELFDLVDIIRNRLNK